MNMDGDEQKPVSPNDIGRLLSPYMSVSQSVQPICTTKLSWTVSQRQRLQKQLKS